MTLRHVALAFLVVAVWGTNFVVVKLGLRALPPFLFVLVRFIFSAIPFVFLLPRPRTPWRWLALYGIFLGAGQFGLLFYAMQEDISPGLASLVIQAQVFFTIALSAWLFRERVTARTIAGSLVAVAGLGFIASRMDASATPAGVAMVLAAALSWGCANVAGKKAVAQAEAPFAMLPFIAWASLFAIPPLLVLTLAFEGAHVAWAAVRDAHAWAWIAVAWQVVGNTLLGFGAWSFLLSRYDAAVVSPWALLIPVFGMASSALLLAEPFPAWKAVGAALVLAGLATIVMPVSLRRGGPPSRRGSRRAGA
jgi:O-acetylserine/cysteine efflux transporter